MTLKRIEPGKRMSQAVMHGNTIYLAGQVGTEGASVMVQSQTALAEVDRLLALAGSDKSHILQIIVWLANMDDFAEMNAVYDAWIDPENPPVRAAGEARLATDGYRVEFIVTAATIG